MSDRDDGGRADALPQHDQFTIVRELGAGSMGIVYEAHDRELGARVALKTMRTANAKALWFSVVPRGGVEPPTP